MKTTCLVTLNVSLYHSLYQPHPVDNQLLHRISLSVLCRLGSFLCPLPANRLNQRPPAPPSMRLTEPQHSLTHTWPFAPCDHCCCLDQPHTPVTLPQTFLIAERPKSEEEADVTEAKRRFSSQSMVFFLCTLKYSRCSFVTGLSLSCARFLIFSKISGIPLHDECLSSGDLKLVVIPSRTPIRWLTLKGYCPNKSGLLLQMYWSSSSFK